MSEQQLTIEKDEFVQDAQEIKAMASQESELVEYIPKSKAPYRLNTLIPRNMAFEVQKALNGVVKKSGNVDNYVRNHLKYKTTEDLWKGLGAEQVDSVALYLNQFHREQGIIIADQTGIGKGRQAASVIRHAILNGYMPVFFTRKPDLFTDMYRDLKNIGHPNINPFIVNTDKDARVKDSDGNVVFSPLSSSEQYNTLTEEYQVPTDSPESKEWHKRIGRKLPNPEEVPTITLIDTVDHVPSEYDVVFTTYSQIQAAHVFKRLWLAKVVASGVEGSKKFKPVVFILDESHMAGGYDSIIGTWMRDVLTQTKACCYLSATFAKYPEVMPLYAKKTAIQEARQDEGNFVGAMLRGGLALQEIVASNLAESGQLIRRQRSNEGIKVDYITLDKEPERSKNRDRVNRIVRLMNEVVKFEEDYITPYLGELHARAKADGENLKQRPRSLGVKQSPYFSRVFNIVDQLLFSLKVEEVAKQAIDLLSENKKVVVAFKSTMGAFLNDLNLKSGDVILPEQMDFARTLIKGLDSVLSFNYTDIEGRKSRMVIDLDALHPLAREHYEEIKKAMWAESTGLSISPIDVFINTLESAMKGKGLGGHDGGTYRVGEVTGRNQRVRFDGNDAIVESFRSDTEKSFRLFNSGELDVLLINQSGSTGSSAHASEGFIDQRIRAMIIHQFELDINVEVQKRGRINRTGQVELPEYYYMVSDIPAEQRLMTMLKGKLKSLDANTTASQKTSDDTLKSPDFFNKYGDKVAWAWIRENPVMKEKLGYPTFHRETDKHGTTRWVDNDSKEGAIKQVTGRAGLLEVADQEEVYKELLQRYEYQTQYEKQSGTYDLETEFLPLDAEIKKRFLFKKGTGGKTPFAKDTIRDESIVNNLKRPYTKDEIDKILVEQLQGKKPKQVQLELVTEIKEKYPKLVEEREEERQKTITKLEKELEEMPAPGRSGNDSGEDDDENDKIQRNRERLQDLISNKQDSLKRYVEELKYIGNEIFKAIQYWEIGEVVSVPILGSYKTSLGIYLGVNIKRSVNNPYTLGNISLHFAVVDSRRMVEYRLSGDERAAISVIYTGSSDLSEDEKKSVLTNWNELVKEASAKREKRHILTENIVAGSDLIGSLNKLIKYNTVDGVIKNGIMLHRDYGKEGEDRNALLPISEAKSYIEGLAIDGIFSDHQLRVMFKRVGTNLFQVLVTKKGNFQIFTSDKLRTLLERAEGQSKDETPDFVQNAGDMTGVVRQKNLGLFLERLDEHGLQFLGEAKELEDWEIENEENWNAKTSRKGMFKYELGRPYGQGSNPTTSFVDYEEPSGTYPHGVAVYDRALSDKEKYNYSLIPVYNNAEEPYQSWKAITLKSAIKDDFIKAVEEAKDMRLNDALLHLGFFITNNPHEDGNPEFVFGRFMEEELGRAAFEDLLWVISPIDELIEKLRIELEKTT